MEQISVELEDELSAVACELYYLIEGDEFDKFNVKLQRTKEKYKKIEMKLANGSISNAFKIILEFRLYARNTLLHMACTMKRISFAEQLLFCDAPVNVRNDSDETPLHIAARLGLECLVVAIVSIGANIFMTDSNWETASEVADKCGGPSVRIAQWLKVAEERRKEYPIARLPAFPLMASLTNEDKWANASVYEEEIGHLKSHDIETINDIC